MVGIQGDPPHRGKTLQRPCHHFGISAQISCRCSSLHFLRLYRTLVTMSSASYYISSTFLPVDQILDDHHPVGLLIPLTLPQELCYVPSMDLIPLEHPTVSQSFFFLFHHVRCYVLVLCASVCFSVISALYLLYGTMCMSMCFSMLLSMHLAHNIHFVPQARARRLRIEITTRLVERSWAKNL